jgi:SAM-dependent methyltransferase
VHPDDLERRLDAALAAGTTEHYADAALYEHEYRRRRDDVRYYRALARTHGGPVLELGAGAGRLLVPLVRDGHNVVGVDLSASMLARCREHLGWFPAEVAARATLVRADFRELRLGRRFPLVVCPFNAFMHLYRQRDVERFLSSVRRHLAPGGLFAFDLMNPDLRWLMRDPDKRWGRTRFRHPTTGRWMIYSWDLAYDAPLQIAFMRIYYERSDGKGRPRVVRLAHRQFFPRELEALLSCNGFRIVAHEGGFDGEPLAAGSEQQVLRCVPAPSRK